MKPITSFWLLTAFLLGTGCLAVSAQTATAQDQPLGDYARKLKKDNKKPARIFDNDSLPTEEKWKSSDNPAPDAEQAQDETAKNAEEDQEQNPDKDQAAEGAAGNKPPAPGKHPAKVEKMPEVSPGESEEARQKVYDKWQEKLDNEKEKLDLASRELDVLQREYKLRVADFYADAGNRLRNQADWDKKDADYKKQIEDKQKALTEAQQDLENMQEDARKAGVPSSVLDKTSN